MLTAEQKSIHERATIIAKNFKRVEMGLIDILQEAHKKKVFLVLGFRSLFDYAISLGLSPANAYAYTKIAKVSETIPELKEQIRMGVVSVTSARRIVPVLTCENKGELLAKASTLSTRELEKEVAAIHPATPRETIRAVDRDRLSLKLGISEEFRKKLKRAQSLLSNRKSRVVTLEEVLEAGLEVFLAKFDPVKKAERLNTKESEGGGRQIKHGDVLNHGVLAPVKVEEVSAGTPILVARPKNRRAIPTAIKRAVLKRDHGRCVFAGPEGQKCGSQYFVQLHHRKPVAYGGLHAPDNLVTLCSSHHRYHHEGVG